MSNRLSKPVKIHRVVVAAACLTVLLAACGSSTKKSTAPSGTSAPQATSGAAGTTGTTAAGGTSTVTAVDTSKCPGSSNTEGVSSTTIKVGTSLPESGPLAFVSLEKNGEQAYFDSINASGGVKGHKIEDTWLDDAYDPAKTASNVEQFLQQDGVFVLDGVIGTPNNLAIATLVDGECVPDIAASTANNTVADKPFITELQPSTGDYPAVVLTQLKSAVPNAKIGILAQSGDLGSGFVTAWKNTLALNLVPGTGATIAGTATFDPTDTTLEPQVTKLVSEGANVIFYAGAGGSTCTSTVNAAAKVAKEVWMATGCSSQALLSLAQPASNVYTGNSSESLNAPGALTSAAIAPYVAAMKKYVPAGASEADLTQAVEIAGWQSAQLLVAILQKTPTLTRTSVIQTAHDITTPLAGQLGLYEITPSNPYGTEVYQIEHYNPTTKKLDEVGSPITKFVGTSGRVFAGG